VGFHSFGRILVTEEAEAGELEYYVRVTTVVAGVVPRGGTVMFVMEMMDLAGVEEEQ